MLNLCPGNAQYLVLQNSTAFNFFLYKLAGENTMTQGLILFHVFHLKIYLCRGNRAQYLFLQNS